jgi:hypothetical protein
MKAEIGYSYIEAQYLDIKLRIFIKRAMGWQLVVKAENGRIAASFKVRIK